MEINKRIFVSNYQYVVKLEVFFNIPWTKALWHGFTKRRPRAFDMEMEMEGCPIMSNVKTLLMVHIQTKHCFDAWTSPSAIQFFWFFVLESLLHSMPYRSFIASENLMVLYCYSTYFPSRKPSFLSKPLMIVFLSAYDGGFTTSRCLTKLWMMLYVIFYILIYI